jgi:hypothetical protein
MNGLLHDARDGVGAHEREHEEQDVDPATPYGEKHDEEKRRRPVVEAGPERGDRGEYGGRDW